MEQPRSCLDDRVVPLKKRNSLSMTLLPCPRKAYLRTSQLLTHLSLIPLMPLATELSLAGRAATKHRDGQVGGRKVSHRRSLENFMERNRFEVLVSTGWITTSTPSNSQKNGKWKLAKMANGNHSNSTRLIVTTLELINITSFTRLLPLL